MLGVVGGIVWWWRDAFGPRVSSSAPARADLPRTSAPRTVPPPATTATLPPSGPPSAVDAPIVIDPRRAAAREQRLRQRTERARAKDRQRRRVVFESPQEQAFVSETQDAIIPDDPLPAHEGTLAFWIQSLWDDGSRDDAEFVQLGRGGLRVVKNVTFLRLEFKDPVSGKEVGVGMPLAAWHAGEWHQIGATWDGRLLWLFIDGAPVTSRAFSGDVAIGADAALLIGSRLNPGAGVAPSLITAVSLRGRPATFQEMARAYARSAPTGDGGPR